MHQLVLIVHIVAAACLIVLVLVQQGKGAGMGASFGAGASQTVFGSRGAGSFLLKLTLLFVLVFFSTSILLNRMSVNAAKHQKTTDVLGMPLTPSVPAVEKSITTKATQTGSSKKTKIKTNNKKSDN